MCPRNNNQKRKNNSKTRTKAHHVQRHQRSHRNAMRLSPLELEHARRQSPRPPAQHATGKSCPAGRPAGRLGARHPAANAGRLRRMVAARLAGRWHCRRGALLLAAQATRPVAVAGRHLDATNWRLTPGLQQERESEKKNLETLLSLCDLEMLRSKG